MAKKTIKRRRTGLIEIDPNRLCYFARLGEHRDELAQRCNELMLENRELKRKLQLSEQGKDYDH